MQQSNKEQKVAALYVRVSTEEQAKEGYSIPAQIEILTQYCKLYNLGIYKVYKDLGISGKSTENRSGLQELLADAKKNMFNVVLVWKTNRLARNLKDLINIVDLLEQHNVAFVSYSEHFDTFTPTGRMTMQILGSIGEFERNTIAENVKMGLDQRVKSGKAIGGIAYGYKSVNKELIIVREEAKVIRRIFELASTTSEGYRNITSTINLEGYRTRKGKPWSANSIRDLLRNPIYIGKLRRNVRSKRSDGTFYETDGMHEPIIDKKMFYRVQYKFKDSPRHPHHLVENDYFLSGILRCPYCRGSMVMRVTRGFRYYECMAYQKYGKLGCTGTSISANRIEQAVLEKLKEVTCSPKKIMAIIHAARSIKYSNIQSDHDVVDSIRKEIEKLEENRRRYFELFDNKNIQADIFVNKLDEISKQLDELNKKKQEIIEQNKISEQNISDHLIAERLRNFSPVFLKSDMKDKKRWIRALIKEIHITRDKKLEEIVFRFPIEELSADC